MAAEISQRVKPHLWRYSLRSASARLPAPVGMNSTCRRECVHSARNGWKWKDAQRGPHVVPLPPIARLLREWYRADGDGAIYAAPAPHGDGPPRAKRSRNLSGERWNLPASIRRILAPASTWGRDAWQGRADAVEAAGSHDRHPSKPRSRSRQALEIRRQLMAWYERQLLTARDGAKVVRLRKATPSS